MNVILGVFTSVLLFINVHPMHVSVTEIEMDEKDKQLEVMMRVFVDDIELTMRQKLNQPALDIFHLKDGLTLDKLMADYLKDHFKITLDNKVQIIKYLGHEVDGEAFILYSEVTNVRKWKTIQVMNDVIMETHSDQSNLINVTVKGDVKSLRLINGASIDKLTFDSK